MGAAFQEEHGTAEREDAQGGGLRNLSVRKHDGRCDGNGRGHYRFGADQQTEGRRQGGDGTIESHDVPTFKSAVENQRHGANVAQDSRNANESGEWAKIRVFDMLEA